MLALTLRQPWSSCVFHLKKDVENRTWTTKYRGLIAIHSGRSLDLHAADWIYETLGKDLIYGAVLGVVELTDIVRTSDSRWALMGYNHWLLSEPHLLPQAVPCVGRQGLFTLPDDVCNAVLGQL